MLGIKYFGHLEHYCFEKNAISDFFGRSVTSPMTSYRFRCKLQNLGMTSLKFIFDFQNFFCSDFLFFRFISDPI